MVTNNPASGAAEVTTAATRSGRAEPTRPAGFLEHDGGETVSHTRRLLTDPLLKAGAVFTERFDWSGVTVGHWYAIRFVEAATDGHRLYECVSRCGVKARLRGTVLRNGGTVTCEGCRPGTAPPPADRIVAADELNRIWGRWPMETTGNNLKGNAAEDWAGHGEPAVRAFLAAAGYPAEWGWKVYVRDCGGKAKGEVQQPVRVRAEYPSSRRVELTVSPAASRYRFHVDLSTGRQCDFPGVLAALKAAANRAAEQPPAPPPEPTPTAASVAAAVGSKVDRLVKMRDGMDTLIKASADIQAAEQMLAEARAALEAAQATAAGPAGELDREGRALTEAEDELAALTAQAADLRSRLEATERAKASAAELVERHTRQRAEARQRFAPLADAVAAAQQAVKDAERMHAERSAAVAKAGDLSVLLAAMERLGG